MKREAAPDNFRNMKIRAAGLLAILSACEAPPEGERAEPNVPEKPDALREYEGPDFMVSREGTVRFLGWFEPVSTMEERYIIYPWTFRGVRLDEPEEKTEGETDGSRGERKPGEEEAQEEVLLYVDARRTGVEVSPWRGHRCIAVGRLRENETVGHTRKTRPDDPKPQAIQGTVLEILAIDVPPPEEPAGAEKPE